MIHKIKNSLIFDDRDKNVFICILIVFSILVLAYLSLLKIENYYFIDDNLRKTTGYTYFKGLNRYTSDYLIRLIGFSKFAYDYSPLLQIVCLFFMAVTSVSLVKIVNGRLETFPVVMSSTLGIYPLFYENVSYIYDSAFMGLSVVASVVPFLFLKNRNIFLIFSVVGILITMTTYQLSSGIYPIVLFAFLFHKYLTNEYSNQKLLRLAGLSLLAYFIALVIYKLFIHQDYYGHITTETFSLTEMPSGVIGSIASYVVGLYSLIGKNWVFLFTLIFFPAFIVKAYFSSNVNRIKTTLVSLGFLFLIVVASPGISTLLKDFSITYRYAIGFNVVVAILVIFISHKATLPIKTVLTSFSIGLVGLTAVYGNAISDQWEYDKFRLEMALSDSVGKLEYPYRLEVNGDPGRVNTFNVQSGRYPVIDRLIFSNLRRYGKEPIIERHIPLFLGYVSDCEGTKENLVDTAFHRLDRSGDCYYLTLTRPHDLMRHEIDNEIQGKTHIIEADRIKVYLTRLGLLYMTEDCNDNFRASSFFLHITPLNLSDLPEDRVIHEFDNFDFTFESTGYRDGKTCVAVQSLPDYPVKELRTGQYNADGTIWSGSYSMSAAQK